MRTLPAAVTDAKNRGTGSEKWIKLVEFSLNDGQESVRLNSSNESVSYAGDTYLPYPFITDDRFESGDGEPGEASISLINIPRITTGGQELSDFFDKHRGGSEATVTITELCDSDAVRTDIYEVGNPSMTEVAIQFPLSKVFIFGIVVPRQTAVPRCINAFRGNDCGYTGAITTCDKGLNTNNGCREKNNQANFKGAPALP